MDNSAKIERGVELESLHDFAMDEYMGGDYTEDGAQPGAAPDGERRLRLQAYNYWTSMLSDKNFPSIRDIDFDALPDFKSNSILLNFGAGLDNPAIEYVGEALATQCSIERDIRSLHDIPYPSVLSHINHHYMQIIASQAPVGFEAEFVNYQDKKVLYRSILLPLSSDNETIDYICGVINWKEVPVRKIFPRQMRHVGGNAVDSVRPCPPGPRTPAATRSNVPLFGEVEPDIIGEILTYYCPQK